MMVNEAVTGLDEYRVTIGEDTFVVTAEDNQRARYKAAELFKGKYSIGAWLTDIATHARAKLVAKLEPYETTAKVLRLLESSNEQGSQ